MGERSGSVRRETVPRRCAARSIVLMGSFMERTRAILTTRGESPVKCCNAQGGRDVRAPPSLFRARKRESRPIYIRAQRCHSLTPTRRHNSKPHQADTRNSSLMRELANARPAIVGLGYVGLPLAVEFGRHYPTVGFDINEQRISDLNRGVDVTLEVEACELAQAKHLRCTTSLA